MTENTSERRTEMKAVDHTHPDTGRPFGEAVVYQRGPAVAADGGEPSETRRTSADGTSAGSERERSGRKPRRSAERSDGGTRGEDEREADPEETDDTGEMRMKDVDHEPPNEAEANRVFERGNEGRDGTR
ncbi:hypothetical protein [Halococcus sp. AFM35]|uniref:hypothetical protein n=1 Tax=Halococcus sp. AFM35 TaxID=3421653 RepID=UPI003EBCAB63